MKLYSLPRNLKTIIFDIDGTLYTSSAYVFEQVDAQVRHLAHIRGKDEDAVRKEIFDYRKRWAAEHGGKKISLGNTLTAFGIPIEESIRWRETLLAPEKYLKQDPRLAAVLDRLARKYRLICVTNNPVAAARKTLDVLGVSPQLPDIIGLDTCMKSKPAPEMLLLAAERTGAAPDECLSVGDRYDIDLALPLEMGMGAVLVSGVEEVYTLEDILL
ncbi:MAG: HAD family hydrolase [Treponema sp.]|nr:HAD family hydrolase [Treponema sp.]